MSFDYPPIWGYKLSTLVISASQPLHDLCIINPLLIILKPINTPIEQPLKVKSILFASVPGDGHISQLTCLAKYLHGMGYDVWYTLRYMQIRWNILKSHSIRLN
jgi:hypothetical protein